MRTPTTTRPCKGLLGGFATAVNHLATTRGSGGNMQVGDLVKLHGSPQLGMGVVLDFQNWNDTVLVQFPSANELTPEPIPVHYTRLEVLNERD